MDLLKHACVTECHKAYELFKHYMHNSPFVEPINEDYINDSIIAMVQSIGVPKIIINASGELSCAQLSIMKKHIEYYENITVKVAKRYGERFLHG